MLLINGSVNNLWDFKDGADFGDNIYNGFNFCMKDVEFCKILLWNITYEATAENFHMRIEY